MVSRLLPRPIHKTFWLCKSLTMVKYLWPLRDEPWDAGSQSSRSAKLFTTLRVLSGFTLAAVGSVPGRGLKSAGM
jgi:hypothetical protein